MTGYITRVSIWFNSEGASPAEVIRKLVNLGFTPVRGAYDFVYEHKDHDEINDATISQAILEISNALHAALSGFKVLYTLGTYHKDDIDEYIPLTDIDAELEETRKELQKLEKEV